MTHAQRFNRLNLLIGEEGVSGLSRAPVIVFGLTMAGEVISDLLETIS